MSIRLLHASDRERWDAFVESAPLSHGYQRAGWATVIERSFGQRPYYLLSEDDAGRVDGVLPLARLRSRLFGDFLVSLPYVNYGGPCGSTPAVESRLVEEAVRIAKDERVGHLELRMTASDGFGLQVKASKVSMQLALNGGADAVWKSFSTKLRTRINGPLKKEGMVARIGREEELDSFYHVFSINMRDLGTPVYAKKFFRLVLREFPDSARICTVYYQNQPVASGFVIGFRDMLEIPWGSSLRSMNRFSPNMLMYWTLLKYACETGYRVFDFGRSSPDSGTYRFKESWGAKPVPLYWHYWLPAGLELPELNPANPKYRFAINVWKHLPVGLTRLIGPTIVRNLP
jgi:serine/alanine adding enzyme